VIRRVDDLANFRNGSPDRCLDTKLQRRRRRAAALTASAKLQQHNVVFHVDYVDRAAVLGDRRSDFFRG
jgi:hypothetical protein